MSGAASLQPSSANHVIPGPGVVLRAIGVLTDTINKHPKNGNTYANFSPDTKALLNWLQADAFRTWLGVKGQKPKIFQINGGLDLKSGTINPLRVLALAEKLLKAAQHSGSEIGIHKQILRVALALDHYAHERKGRLKIVVNEGKEVTIELHTSADDLIEKLCQLDLAQSHKNAGFHFKNFSDKALKELVEAMLFPEARISPNSAPGEQEV